MNFIQNTFIIIISSSTPNVDEIIVDQQRDFDVTDQLTSR
jgi:hypothetical protein